MTVLEMIKEYHKKYENYCFYLKKNESIDKVLTKEKIPNKYGIYIIYSVKDDKEKIIYIGKSGTINNNGTFKKQGLAKRLKAKQNSMPRREFFQKIIQEYDFDKLKFLCFITFDDFSKQSNEIPILAEAKFIQSYFSDHKKLPLLNKSA